MYKLLTILAISLTLTSCANPVNRATAQQYYGGGVQNQNKGEWGSAAFSFRRAYINSQVGNLSDKEAALFAYEYGRSSGAICDWENAKQGLDKAYELDVKIGAPLYFDLVEYALMYQAMGEFEKSQGYYAKAISSLDTHNVLDVHPLYYADTLSRYSALLKQLGNNEKAEILKKRADVIVKETPNSHPYRAIPYGKFCEQKPKVDS